MQIFPFLVDDDYDFKISIYDSKNSVRIYIDREGSLRKVTNCDF